MWMTISHGNDSKPLASSAGEGLTSADDEQPPGRRLEGNINKLSELCVA